jgi:hypothetical protein
VVSGSRSDNCRVPCDLACFLYRPIRATHARTAEYNPAANLSRPGLLPESWPSNRRVREAQQTGRPWYNGHPILAWTAGHRAVRLATADNDNDENDNVNFMQSRSHSTARIGNVVAVSIGLSKATFQQDSPRVLSLCSRWT